MMPATLFSFGLLLLMLLVLAMVMTVVATGQQETMAARDRKFASGTSGLHKYV